MPLQKTSLIKEGYVTSKYGTLGLLKSYPMSSNSCKSYRKRDTRTICMRCYKVLAEISSIPVAPAITNAYRRIDENHVGSLPIKHTGYKKIEYLLNGRGFCLISRVPREVGEDF